jgi:oligo-alginate lyase
MKANSAFYPKELVQRARANAKKHAWARAIQQKIVKAAEPWKKMSDEHLWSLMFGNTIKRSWMVWSNGYCPACNKSVPMYNWKIDAVRKPWKVWCPHCKEIFPKNDFAKFYRSGLDAQGVFDPKKANRKLLFNVEHPDPKDPKRTWGVDDGEGFVGKWKGRNRRWRFIGAYIIYGQWKQAILGGLKRLSAAYVVTGDPAYAHKAGIILDRIADLYPTFSFQREGVLYEGRGARGYVSTWHDACEEVREIVLCYDRVFEGMRDDKALITFLSAKAKEHKLANTKATFTDVQRNIENRILLDTWKNRQKIKSNQPRTAVALLAINTVLTWPTNRARVLRALDNIVQGHTQVDGVTGEKGMGGYTTIGPRSLAEILERFAMMDESLLADLLKRRPQLLKTWRFHIDMQCLGAYYPQSGDSGAFAMKMPEYRGVGLGKQGAAGSLRSSILRPSGWTFLSRLHRLTGDPDYARLLYRTNGNRVAGLPHDIFAADPAAIEREVAKVIKQHGADVTPASVNKQAWHLGILRSGQGKRRRAMWLDYDSKHGNHSHYDGMNLGLFAKGLDLMPDLGYPPVQFGGWGGSRFAWYVMSASHNTVVVNGRNNTGVGKTTLWADGDQFRVIRASAARMGRTKQFERTAAMVDISDTDFYVLDVFRVVGGTDHAKFMHSHFAETTTKGLTLKPSAAYGHSTIMNSFRTDAAPTPGWSVDFRAKDYYGYLPKNAPVTLRYTDLTSGAAASLCKAWVVAGSYNSSDQQWIPRVMVRRQSKKAPLVSTFVAVIEPFGKASAVKSIRRMPLVNAKGQAFGDADVAVEVTLNDGRKDLLIFADVKNPLGRMPSRSKGHILFQKDWGVRLDGQACLVRTDKKGVIQKVALCKAKGMTGPGLAVKLKGTAAYIELDRQAETFGVVAGDKKLIEEIVTR